MNNQNIWISCNYGASMEIEATSMSNTTEVNDGPDAADFTDTIPFLMGLNNSNGLNNTVFNRMFFNTADGANGTNSDSKTNADAFHDLAQLQIILNPGNIRPLAGAYEGSAEINVGAI